MNWSSFLIGAGMAAAILVSWWGSFDLKAREEWDAHRTYQRERRG
jgi:hypothetical protein